MKNNIFSNFKFKLEFILVYLIHLLLNYLPSTFASILGGFLFKIIGPFTKTHKIVKKNLFKILPNEKNSNINKLARESWVNVGKTFFELLILPKIINNSKINFEGTECLNLIKKNNEKVIFIGIHQSNWEILLPSIDKLGLPVGGIYRHINNPYINKLILDIRNKSILTNKSFYTPKGKKSAKDIIEGIKKDISIVLLIDQRDSAGELVNFFDYPTKTQIGFIKIARKHNLKIVPVENTRNNKDIFTLKFYPPIGNFEKSLSDVEIMKQIHNIIEQWIKKYPSNYFLQHNRFN